MAMVRRLSPCIRSCGRLLPVGLLVALLLSAPDAQAGKKVVVHKKDGSRVPGEIVREETAWIEVKTSFGPQKVYRTDIDRIEEGISREAQLKRRRQEVEDTDGQGLMRLARWCEEQKMMREALDLYTEAADVAGPHYLDANFRLAGLAMREGEYRLAVEHYLDLADRLRQEKAWEALKRAEDRLRHERLKVWERANDELAGGRYHRAILGYCQTLYRTVHDEPQTEGDVGRIQVKQKLLDTRLAYLAELRKKLEQGSLLETDPGGISWHYTTRPKNLRGQTWAVTIEQLRLETERFVGRWVAVRGTFQGFSEWNSDKVRAIKIADGGHPELAVAAYLPPARVVHGNLLAERPTGNVYLKELIGRYPYEAMQAATDLLSPGREVVCYGRLRRRLRWVPQYVLEIWAVESVRDPEALQLANFLKRRLSCEFADTPLVHALSHIEMLSQVKVDFAMGKIPEVPVALKIKDQPTGYAISRIAKELGLEWTRKGSHIVMKKSLTEKEKLLQKQVKRLATDRASR